MRDVRGRMRDGLTRDRLQLEARRALGPLTVWLALLLLGVASTGLLLTKLHVRWPWQDRYEVRVEVADAKGVVSPIDEVRISGVVVGRIVKTQLEGDKAVLTASIGREFGPLYRDARLRLRPRTPLEDMYLNVTDRGTPRAGRVPDGGRLQADRTQTPVHIGQVLDVFDADVRPRVKAAIDSTGRGLGDHGDDFREALVRLAPLLRSARRLTHQLAVHREQTRRLVHDYAILTGELARRGDQVTRLVRAGSETFGELGSVDAPLARLIEQMPPTLRQMPPTFTTVRAAADELEPAFDALRPAARAMPAAYAALERLGPELRRGAAALRRPMPRLRRLVIAARPVATNLSEAFAQLRPAPPRLDRVLAAIVPCELAVQKFFHNTISLLKFYDALSVRPRGRQRVGTNTAGGAVADPALTSEPSCAKGGPRK